MASYSISIEGRLKYINVEEKTEQKQVDIRTMITFLSFISQTISQPLLENEKKKETKKHTQVLHAPLTFHLCPFTWANERTHHR